MNATVKFIFNVIIMLSIAALMDHFFPVNEIIITQCRHIVEGQNENHN